MEACGLLGASVTHTGTQLAHSFQRCGHHLLPPAESHRPSASLAIPLSLSDLWLGPGFGCRISPLPNLDWLFAMEKLKTCSLDCSRWSILPHIFVVVTFFWISTSNSELTWHDQGSPNRWEPVRTGQTGPDRFRFRPVPNRPKFKI